MHKEFLFCNAHQALIFIVSDHFSMAGLKYGLLELVEDVSPHVTKTLIETPSEQLFHF